MKAIINLFKNRLALSKLPRGVWALGFVSLWMDVSSEMIHALLPIYLVTTMGATMMTVGIIEGIAEATAAITKLFSGAISDWLGKRKPLAVLGYGLAALTKPVFPLAPTIGWLIGARFIDRVGKGIRGAPRDALIADLTSPEQRGAGFGLRQSLDTVGAFLGPLVAIGLMWLTSDNIPMVFWFSMLPAVIAVYLLVTRVSEPEHPAPASKVKSPLSLGELRLLGRGFWMVVIVACIYTLGRFSEAFLILKAHSEGVSVGMIPLVLVVLNISFAAAAYPAGALSDRRSRIEILAIGAALLVVADLILALLPGQLGLLVGLVLWGVHMGFTQGAFAALVADCAPVERRGTAFGMLHLVTGVAILIASVMAGLFWDIAGPQSTFLVGAAIALLSLMTMWPLSRVLARQPIT